MRVKQPEGNRGSLKWIQRAVNTNPDILNELLLPKLDCATNITWRSPLADDEYAEYRDADFLQLVGAGHLTTDLARFWPSRGPQWDALAVTDAAGGGMLLVEAKAHIPELCSPGTAAGWPARHKIEEALSETAMFVHASPCAPWHEVFYQLANRIAHLYFLRKNNCNAWLVLMNFVGDKEMDGPSSELEWKAAYQVARHVLGIPKRHPLARYIIDLYPDVKTFEVALDDNPLL